MEALRNTPSFLGTSASLLIDLTLVIQVLFFITLCLGATAQLRGFYHWHDRLQIPVVVLNLFFIIFVMIPTFRLVASQLPGGLRQTGVLVPTIHATLGTTAEVLGIYCLLAGLKILPRKIGVLRYWMWTTFVFWTAAILFGVGVYIFFYTGAPASGQTVSEHDEDLAAEHAEESVTEEATEPEDEAAAEEVVAEHDAEAVLDTVSEHDGEAVIEEEISEGQPGILTEAPRNYELVQGWYQGRQTFYYEFGTNSQTTEDGSQVVPAPIYVLVTGFDADGNPQVVEGQHNIVDVVPGDEGYSDLWQVTFVTVPEDYEANSITSVAEVLDGGYELTVPGVLVNCPIVPAGSTLAEGDAPLVQGWYKGQEVFYFDFGQNIENTAPIYAFITGFDEDGNPQFVEGQQNVVGVIPGDEGYSAFWYVNLVMVPEDYEANSITSVADVLAAEYEIVQPGLLVNCPIVRTEEPAGRLFFTDGQNHGDQVNLEMAGVPPLLDDSVYEAWLGLPGESPLSVGRLTLDGDTINHTFVDPEGRNLLGIYSNAFITIEPADDEDPAPSEVIAYAGSVAPAVIEQVRLTVVAAPDTPDGDGYAFNGWAEVEKMFVEVGFQQDYSIAEDDLPALKIQAEGIINVLEGTNGPNYGDSDGNGEVYIPGESDGVGLLGEAGYLQRALGSVNAAAQADGATPNVALYAGQIQTASENALSWAEQIRDLELQILAVDNTADAADMVTQVVELANGLRDTEDVNLTDPSQSGVRAMYVYGQLMGAVELFSELQPEAPPDLIGEHDADDLISEHDAGE